MTAECFRCGSPAEETFGGTFLCDDCTPSESGGEDSEEAAFATFSGEKIYPDAIKNREWWVTWILDDVGRKRPVAPWVTGHAYPVKWKGSLDDAERPETDFETAELWASLPPEAQDEYPMPDDAQTDWVDVGIILPRDRPEREQRITLIDWDDVRDPETEELHPVAAEYIRRFGGYVEISQSGSGLHQFVFGGIPGNAKKFIRYIDDEPFVGDDRPQVEIYDGGRHTAMTGRHVEGTDEDVLSYGDPEKGEGGQALINELVERFVEAGNASTENPSDPTSSPSEEQGDEGNEQRESLTTEEAAELLERANDREYEGPDPDEWEIPEDRNIAYHAAVEAHYGGYAHVNFWRVTSAAAAHGQALGKSPDDVIDDLRGTDRPGESEGWGGKTEERVRYDHERARTGEFHPPSHARLAAWGILPPEYAEKDDSKPVSSLPLGRLKALNRDEARRYAKKQGVEWPTTREARRQLNDRVMTAMREREDVVIDAPTALGKSYGVATERWLDRADVTSESPVVQFHETREARDQAAEDSDEANVAYARLLGRTEACPVAAGFHDPETVEECEEERAMVTLDGVPASEWLSAVCEGRGVPFSVAHRYLDENHDQGHHNLPCCGPTDATDVDPEEDDEWDQRCPAIAQWDNLPRDDDGNAVVDVIHATHQFAHVPSLRNGTNMVFDERPEFTADLPEERVRQGITAFLREANAPVRSFEELVTAAKSGGVSNEHAEKPLRDALEYDPGREWYLENPDAHTLAPALSRATYYAFLPDDDEEDAADENGRYSATVTHEPPRLDADAKDDDGWNREWVSVVYDDAHSLRHVRTSPDLTLARCVIGLDAHPSMHRWQLNTKPSIRAEPLLDPEKRRLWRLFERGLLVVQVGENTRPLTSGEYFDEDGTTALIRALRDEYGEDFRTAITASSVEGRLEKLMRDVGVDDPETMHYGEEKSRGDFADEDVGFVNGCVDPGDGPILDLLAERDLDARPETTTDEEGNEHRARGRGFVGPDAEAAAEFLASVREQHVAQAAGRYARNADDSDDTATVFVRTDATPVGFSDLKVPGVEWVATELQREIIDSLRSRSSATAAELADEVGCSKEHVRKTLKRLVEKDAVACREGGEWGAHVYRALADTASAVELGEPEKIANDGVWSSYTWSLAIFGGGARIAAESTRAPAGSRRPDAPGGDTATGDQSMLGWYGG